MAIRFVGAAPLCASPSHFLLSPCWPTAHAEDAPAPAQQPAAAPSGQKSGGPGGRAATSPASPAAAEQHRLPPDSTTKQTLALPGRTLAFTATAGSIRLFDVKGEPQADIAYTAYQLDGADPATRPVTFLFNGGPGAASAYLQLGAAGPWRLNIDGDAAIPSASPDLQPNAETWLDFTDLVFIDPVGTGYSRFVATGDDVRKRFFSVDGDVNAIALTIRRWLEKSGRLLSPKYVAGESYGGMRGPKIVRNLQIGAGRRRQGPDPRLAGVRFPRIHRLQHPAICLEPSHHGRGGAREEGSGFPGRHGRRRKLCARRVHGRSPQGRGRYRGHDAPCRQVRGIDGDRSGVEPQARRAFRRHRVPPRIRPQGRQGDGTLRRFS